MVSTSPKLLRELYKENDEDFPDRRLYEDRIGTTLSFLRSNMPFVGQTHLTKTHVFFSLVCALIHNRWGLPNAQQSTGLAPIGQYLTDIETAEVGLRALAAAHEEKDLSRFEQYVKAASEGGNRAPQRVVRLHWLCRALRGEIR